MVKVEAHSAIILARISRMELDASIDTSMEQAMKSVMNSIVEMNKKLDEVQMTLKSLDARVGITGNITGKTIGETNSSISAMRLG